MTPAWRCRLLAGASVGLVLVAARVLEPELPARLELLYAVALPLGYAHLLGGALPLLRVGIGTGGAERLLLAASLATGVLAALAVYAWAVAALGLVFGAGLLVVSSWHVVENDLALAAAGGRRIGALPRTLRYHLGAGVCTLVAVALTAPFPELIAATTLYHVVSWLLASAERWRGRRGSARSRRALRRLFWLHGVPLATCVLLQVTPVQGDGTLRDLLLAPSLFFFWSSLHVLQTAWSRGLAPRAM